MNFFDSIKESYKGVFNSFTLYWKTYGSFKSLLSSPYLHFSVIFSAICWTEIKNLNPKTAWYDLCVSILPNILGFTLGGYALLLAFGDEKFRSCLAGAKEDELCSPFFEVNAAFLHFIVLQIAALLFGILCLIWKIKHGFVAYFGFTIFIYSISSALAAAFAVLRIARWYDLYVKNGRQ